MSEERGSAGDEGPTPHVIKVGGAQVATREGLAALTRHVRDRAARGERVLVVHGGGPEIGALQEALRIPVDRREGLRVTSPEGMRVTTMVLCGLVNKRIVARFVREGLRAVGLSGVDLGLLRAPLLDPARFGRVGGTPTADAGRLRALLDAGLLPVLAPVSLAPDGRPVNVNADTAANAVASALGAATLDFVSDVPGVRTRPDTDAVAARIPVAEARRLLDGPSVVGGGMVPKLRAAVSAIAAGVARVRVGDLQAMADGTATEVTA